MIARTQQHLPDRLLLAEVTVQPYDGPQARVWSLQPDTPWAQAEGPRYTY